MIIEACTLCPRLCHARREDEKGDGYCGMGTMPTLARAMLHQWEEPLISGARGSGTIFFSGCTLRCVYCQNYAISHERFGKVVDIPHLRGIMRDLIGQGAHNINLVSPTPYIPAIVEVLTPKPPVPVVWNTGGYERVESLRMLDGLVDVYLPDLKYLDAQDAGRYSGAVDYPEVAKAAILEMARQAGPVELDDQGIIRRGLIVRHLVLPGLYKQSIEIMDWLVKNLPYGCYISLMSQYVPAGQPDMPKALNRRITRFEYDRVVGHLRDTGWEHAFTQERSAADRRYTPDFDLGGVQGDVTIGPTVENA